MQEYLNKVYNQINSARRFQLECEIASCTHESLFIQKFYSSFQKLLIEFSDIICDTMSKKPLSNVLAIHEVRKHDQFLMKLGLDFENFCSNLMSCNPSPT